MSYSVEIVDLLHGQASARSASGVDGRIIAVKTDDRLIRDSAVQVEGVATWEASKEADDSWIIYLAPAHGISVSLLCDHVVQHLALAAARGH